ncbi:hypothetical protein PPTG_01383 [Phytophthora nicotianae INRA-310]|uniref:HTH CENPB-type domain-containing protein n=1 Tax=Phytophthora nicotianae (strain INRA-310) TaxID=761204 RepID=W2R749_PHYN3|nr:hypothetical protein PPTG_01383 [Phytophthora nicotianae INRA-310]ETN21076.1 hypothetical protein PPTG_01383 [Phytophthora nicotianae INRA-310]
MRDAQHTNAQLLQAIIDAGTAGVSKQLAEEHGCDRTTLYRWTKRRKEIEAVSATSRVLLPGRRGPKVKFPDLEKQLLGWVTDMQDRSEQAAIEYLRRFRVRKKLSVRRITHKGQRKRSELQVVQMSLDTHCATS